MIAMSFRVPAMTSRASVRAISARVSDVAGVRTLAADLRAGTVVVTGSADPAQGGRSQSRLPGTRWSPPPTRCHIVDHP
jgi:hypothetical protein